MRFFNLILIISFVSVSAYSQLNTNQRRIDVFKQIPVLVEDFLREEFVVLPGDQLYKAQDLWEQAGSKKVKTTFPKNSDKSKDILKNIVIEDAGSLMTGFKNFTYVGKNETIVSMKINCDLNKGDYFLDKFIELKGRYAPIENNSNNVAYSGSYTFDDFIIKVTEFNDEFMQFSINENPAYNKLPKNKIR